MEDNYTEKEFIKYLYHELTPLEEEKFNQRLGEDFFLQENLENFRKTYDFLDSFSENPHPSSVSLILEYSLKKFGSKPVFV